MKELKGKSLYYRVEGGIFKEGMPVHVMHKQLGNLQRVFDGAYLAASGGDKIPGRSRERFYLASSKVETGSMLVDFCIALASSGIPLTAAGEVSPESIWASLKQAYGVLKGVYAHVHAHPPKKGERLEASVSQENLQQQGGSVNVKTLTGDVSVNNITYNTMININKPVKQMAAQIDGGKYRSFQIGESGETEDDGIKISEEEKEIFRVRPIVSGEKIRVQCEIYDFDKFKHEGRLLVPGGEIIAAGKYRFKVASHGQDKDYIMAMLKSKVIVDCVMEKEVDPITGTDKIVRLIILDIAQASRTTLL